MEEGKSWFLQWPFNFHVYRAHAHTRVCMHKCISLMNAVFKNCTKKTMYLLSDSVDTEHLGSWMAGRNKEWSVKGLDVLLWKVLKIFEVQLWVIHYVDHQKLFEKENDDADAGGGAKERNHASHDTSWAHVTWQCSMLLAPMNIWTYEQHFTICSWEKDPWDCQSGGILERMDKSHCSATPSKSFLCLTVPCTNFTSVSPWL